MSCFYPLRVEVPGRKNVKVACGRCRGCRFDYSKDWALRCVHEASMFEENCFITLTYNDGHLPADRSVAPAEMQGFMKRLRKAIEPQKVRFFGVGEYGEKLGRPHYHLLLFGFDFPDKVLLYVQENPQTGRISTNSSYRVESSALLNVLWGKGYTYIGRVNYQSAGYCARYAVKKIGGEKAKDHYKGLHPEFCLMSRHPGIGATWFKKYLTDVFPKDYTTFDGKRFRPCRYYDEKLKRANWEMFESVKAERLSRVKDEDIIRRKALEKYHVDVTQTLKRRYEG